MNAMTAFHQCFQQLGDWFFPSFCVQCQSIIRTKHSLCEHCLADLPLLDITTHANLLYRPDVVELFPDCQFDYLFACAWYRPPFDGWLTQLKFSNQIHYKNALSLIISQQLTVSKKNSEIWPDLFIILPLHQQRFLKRGFNQVSQCWLPCLVNENIDSQSLQRTKKTQAQSSLSKAKRVKNLHGAFICNTDMSGKTVAIIDDVMTTGATLNAATVALKKAGAKQVWAFVTCLTPLGH
jgi:ComF family protein|tara:strand:- start:3855 stop:4565 length:711 start_codon:yes stop_codon:yes gene_type:complete